MGADISQFKQADLVKHIPDLAKIDEHFHNGEGGRKFQISKSHSPSFAHFSDYSMFPDRFNGKSSPRAILGHSPPTEGGPHFSDYSLYPDKFDKSQKLLRSHIDQHQSLPTPSGLISRYNFRIRRSSESDDTEHSEIHEPIPEQRPEQRAHRARSLSQSNSKMYYFDFSLIPDKDPHCAQDEICTKQGKVSESLPPSIIIEENMTEPPTSPCQEENPGPISSRKMKRTRKNSEPRYGFFDFSMIPDKDPRFYARSKSTSSSPDEKTLKE